MKNTFVSKIMINKARHLKNITLELSRHERKHLILTGKNGSGKTSVLQAIRNNLKVIEDKNVTNVENWKGFILNQNNIVKDLERQLKEEKIPTEERSRLEQYINNSLRDIDQMSKSVDKYEHSVRVHFNNPSILESMYDNGQFILAYYDSKRSSNMNIPSGIKKIELNTTYKFDENPGISFVQYLVNLRAQKSFARDEGHHDEVRKIDRWFRKFERGLRDVFEKDIKLEFDYQNYNFNIIETGKEKYNLNTLSDGYSAVLNIITDLIMRMEKRNSKAYDITGVVLIDEIETHLHVSLQKKILPFLSDFFPNIQFIITTHSPFVLNSIEDAIIYDLEHQLRLEDLSSLSYSGIIEGYFNIDKYSNIAKDKFKDYQLLFEKDRLNMLNNEEIDRMMDLKMYLKEVPDYLSPELKSKFYELEAIRIADNMEMKK
ncbi:AAA family ATPase [Bacillus sp. FSL H8-0547]